MSLDVRRFSRIAAAWALLGLLAVACSSNASQRADPPLAAPLPSWNDGPAKTAILEFVAAVTDEDSLDYVEPDARIAAFDNDGTL